MNSDVRSLPDILADCMEADRVGESLLAVESVGRVTPGDALPENLCLAPPLFIPTSDCQVKLKTSCNFKCQPENNNDIIQ